MLAWNEFSFIVHTDGDEDDDEQSCSTQECEVEVGVARAVVLFKPGVPRIISLNPYNTRPVCT